MKKLVTQLFLISFLFFGGIFLLPASIQAEGEFQTDLKSVYTVSAVGEASVEHSFVVTNLTPSYYIAKYGYQTSLPGIANVSVSNEGAALTPQVVTTDEKTSISFSFPSEVVGEGKQRHFAIRYSSPVFASLTGSVLEVTIPRTQKTASYTESQIEVRVPKRFGQPYRLEPQPSSTTSTASYSIYYYSNYTGEGVSMVFGEKQWYALDLTYYLDNPEKFPVSTEITLPPDTRFQRLVYTELEPKPVDFSVDGDGNWIAEYHLNPSEQIVVHALAYAEVSVTPQQNYPKIIPNARWTRSQEYWETNSEVIASLAQEYQTPKAIYEVVTDLLDYTTRPLTQERIRYGAADSIEQSTDAVCQEFTDLFIAIARKNNIHARRATGYAFTSQPELRPLSLDADILHTWPEFYDNQDQVWQPIDPTWADTTGGVDYFNFFDLNHIVFAYNGLSSTLPPPAGVFKPADSTAQTVVVEVTDTFPEGEPTFTIALEPISQSGFPVPAINTITLTNQTGQAWYDVALNVAGQSKTIEPYWFSADAIPKIILPFEQLDRIVLFTSRELLPSTDTIVVSLANRSGPDLYVNSEKPVLIIPFYLTRVEFYFGVGIFFSLSALITGSLLVLRHKRPTTLRRQSQKPKAPTPELHQNKKQS